jgi:dTDP-4-amino-4,6-dideoxygalactose transaminase
MSTTSMNKSIDSGAAVRPLQPASGGFAPWPYFAADEIDAAKRVLESGKVNYWTGNEGRDFEKEFAQYTDARHAIALANGTVSLELALRALGIGAGHEVITTPRTFIASASCVISVGARPVFADVDRESQNITAETIERVITPATRAIIPVHLAGRPCEMDAIMDLARMFDLKVIEDCAQAHGAAYKGRPVGQFEQAWAFKDHGKSYDAVYRRSHQPGFRWLHESFGTNWRLTEIQSAIGRVQLKKLPEWVRCRRANAEQLEKRFSEISALRVTPTPNHIRHSYYKYYVFVRPEALAAGWSRDRVLAEISLRGVPCYSGSCSEVYLEKAFPAWLRPSERLPIARELGETSLMFLVHPTLSIDNIATTCDVVEQVMQEATR